MALTKAATLLFLAVAAHSPASAQLPGVDSGRRTFIRINQLGYLPDGPKTAVACSLDSTAIATFTVQDGNGRVVLGPGKAVASGAFGPCASTHRLDFSALRKPGNYTVVAGGASSPRVRISSASYNGAADTLLYYMRQQRSGFNPIIRDSVHKRDGLIVDDPARVGKFIDVSGGWADASDYLST